jgi:hypothetical protein
MMVLSQHGCDLVSFYLPQGRYLLALTRRRGFVELPEVDGWMREKVERIQALVGERRSSWEVAHSTRRFAMLVDISMVSCKSSGKVGTPCSLAQVSLTCRYHLEVHVRNTIYWNEHLRTTTTTTTTVIGVIQRDDSQQGVADEIWA